MKQKQASKQTKLRFPSKVISVPFLSLVSRHFKKQQEEKQQKSNH